MRLLWILSTSLLTITLLGSLARAQDQMLENAKQHFDEGQSLYLQGKYLEAAQQFDQAYKVKPFPAFLFNVAVCYEKNRDFVKALKLYERYLTLDPHSQDRKVVLKRIAGIRKHLSPPAGKTHSASQPTAPPPDLPPVRTKGLVVIESKPEGAAIYLGEKSKGIFTRTPYTGSLPPGRHTVIIELKRYTTERKTFVARTDRMVYLYFALSLEKTRGWIEVKANIPGAEVFVDRKEVGAVGQTPYTGWLRPGKHKIYIERDGYAPVKKVVTITPGEVHVVSTMLKKVSYGWLKVTGKTTRGSVITVNGKPVTCSEYPCRAELPGGTYTVALERDGFKSYSQDLTISQATETHLAVKLNPKPSRLKAYISFGAATALLVGAITTGVMSNNRKSALEDDLSGGRIFDSSDPRITEGKITAITANSLFALSGLVGALGIYYMLRNVGPDSYGETRNRKIAITPALGSQTAGISTSVRF